MAELKPIIKKPSEEVKTDQQRIEELEIEVAELKKVVSQIDVNAI